MARRSKKVKKFLNDFCNLTVHQFDEDTLRCSRCGRHAGEIEKVNVYVNGLLQTITRDYNVRRVRRINKVVFSFDIEPYSIVHIEYFDGQNKVLTTHRTTVLRKDFTFRKA